MIRFAYGCLPSLPSLYFANYIIRRGKLRPACIVLSDGGLRFKGRCYSNSQVLPLLLRHFGMKFTFYQALLGLGGMLGSTAAKRRTSNDRGPNDPGPNDPASSDSGLWSFKRLAREFDIELLTSVDFSGAATLQDLQRSRIDLFATCMCDQIVREPLLSTPRAGCVNVHFALLPDFRGVDSIFQSMLCGVSEMGATLHRAVSRIDAGDSICRMAFARTAQDSHLLLLAKAAVGAAQLLQGYVEALERGATPTATPLDLGQARYPYRSWPEREELQRFQAQGLVFWRASDFKRLLRFEDVLADTALLAVDGAGMKMELEVR